MSDAEFALLLVRRAYEAHFGSALPVPRASAPPAASGPRRKSFRRRRNSKPAAHASPPHAH